MTKPFNFAIDLPGRSEWQSVDLLRTSVQNCFMVMFSDIDGCETIAMVCGELLENAVKYGNWSGDCREFRLRVTGEDEMIRIAIENPIKADDAGAHQLVAMLAEIAAAPSAADAYRARLLELATAPGDGSSRLGLARICHEANCALTAVVSEGTLQVTALIPTRSVAGSRNSTRRRQPIRQ